MSEYKEQIAAYLHTHEQLKAAIEGLKDEELGWKPAPAKWSINEVLSHLADHNIVVSFRLRDILADSTAQLPAFNQDLWVSGAKANEGSAWESLAVFQALLVYNSFLLRRLSSEEWQKSGVNFKGVRVTIADAVSAFTAHVQTHLAQIERNKSALQAAPL